MTKLFDEKCLELARHFLEGKGGERRATALAEEIQGSIEDFIFRAERYDHDLENELKHVGIGAADV